MTARELLQADKEAYTTAKGESLKDVGDGVAQLLSNFGKGIENFSLNFVNVFKGKDDIHKTTNEYRIELNNIVRRVTSNFERVGKNGSKIGVDTYNASKNELITYVTSTGKPAYEIGTTLENSAGLIKRCSKESVKGLIQVSKYIETLMNSEAARTAKQNGNLDGLVRDFLSLGKELNSAIQNVIDGSEKDVIEIGDVFTGARDYMERVEQGLKLTKTLEFGFINDLHKEIEHVYERVGIFSSYLEDGVFKLGENVEAKLIDVIQTFSTFVTNVSLLCVIFKEYMESLIATGRVMEARMPK